MAKGRVMSGMAGVLVLCAAAGASTEGVRDLYADTWVAVDALGRPVATAAEAGPPREEKTVGIFYYIWHGVHGYDHHYNPEREPDSYQGVLPLDPSVRYRSPYLIPEILQAPLGEREWGPSHAFHHWARPVLGVYLSNDRWVYRRHAQMLSDAGVDVLILDNTNSFHYRENYMTLLDVLAEMRAEGLNTPQVAFMTNFREDLILLALEPLWNDLYSKGLYEDLWFRWQGKPLILSNSAVMTDEMKEFFTVRRCWAWSRNIRTGEPTGWFGDGQHAWSWVDHTPQQAGWDVDPSVPEGLSVATAQHPTTNIGKSFQNGTQPEVASPSEGLYFAEQWESALETDPAFILLTQWNEWTAMRFINRETPRIDAKQFAGMEAGDGDSIFVDGLDDEYNRDIEPIRGSYGDNYYYQMIDGIRRFKGVREVPVASPAKTIRFDNGFADWAEAGPEYRDSTGDTTHRNHPGWGSEGMYVDETGRNDFETLKVARDADHLYFYARTVDEISPPAGENWMELFLAFDGLQGVAPDWEGLHFRVRLEPRQKRHYVVEQSLGGFHWRGLGTAEYAVEGRELQIKLDRSLLGDVARGEPLDFRFKWSDNRQTEQAIDWLIHGDTAPNARFQYRYRTE